MTITAIAPWFGSKRDMSATIVAELGPHRCYWEPFCGSMAVLLAKPVCSMETVNDLHGDLVNMARVLRDDRAGPALYRRLRRVLPAQDELMAARERLREGAALANGGLDPERAEAYFMNSWLSMNGTAGSLGSGEAKEGATSRRGIAQRFTSNGGAPGKRFSEAVGSIPNWRRRLREVFVLRGCGIEMCGKIEDKDGTVIYADPPYLVKKEKYVCDFEPADHERLAAALRRLNKTRCVVSYYAHPDLARLYPGWTVVEHSKTKSLGQRESGKSPDKVAPEVLLINGPSLGSEGNLFGG